MPQQQKSLFHLFNWSRHNTQNINLNITERINNEIDHLGSYHFQSFQVSILEENKQKKLRGKNNNNSNNNLTQVGTRILWFIEHSIFEARHLFEASNMGLLFEVCLRNSTSIGRLFQGLYIYIYHRLPTRLIYQVYISVPG